MIAKSLLMKDAGSEVDLVARMNLDAWSHRLCRLRAVLSHDNQDLVDFRVDPNRTFVATVARGGLPRSWRLAVNERLKFRLFGR